MRTSEVAAQAAVNAQTLRYYERRGLLILSQAQALRLGVDIFGLLFNDQSGRPA